MITSVTHVCILGKWVRNQNEAFEISNNAFQKHISTGLKTFTLLSLATYVAGVEETMGNGVGNFN